MADDLYQSKIVISFNQLQSLQYRSGLRGFSNQVHQLGRFRITTRSLSFSRKTQGFLLKGLRYSIFSGCLKKKFTGLQHKETFVCGTNYSLPQCFIDVCKFKTENLNLITIVRSQIISFSHALNLCVQAPLRRQTIRKNSGHDALYNRCSTINNRQG